MVCHMLVHMVCWCVQPQVGIMHAHYHKSTHTCPNRAILGFLDSWQCQLPCAGMQWSAGHGDAALSSSVFISSDYSSCKSLKQPYLGQNSPKSSEKGRKMTVGTCTVPCRKARGHIDRWRLFGSLGLRRIIQTRTHPMHPTYPTLPHLAHG